MPQADRDYSIVIGVDHYPGYRSLRGARADAQTFETWLSDSDVGGGLPPANRRLVLSTPDPIRPIQDDIDDAFVDLLRQTRQSGGRRFYLFFSGHGLSPNPEEVSLCLAKWSDEQRNAALNFDDYLKALMNFGRFEEVFAFLDCCRVWSVSVDGLRPTWEPAGPVADVSTRKFIAYATEYRRVALEAPVSRGGIHPNPVRGHFSRALMSGLYGAAAGPQGGVLPAKLKSFLEFETPRVASQSGHSQRSVVLDGLEGTSPPLGSALDRGAVRISFNAVRRGEVVLEGPAAVELRRGPVAGGPWDIQLEYATHLLTEVGTGDSRSFVPRPKQTGEPFDVEF